MERQAILDVIGQMERARIGSPNKWKRVARKVRSDLPLTTAESEYYARLTRIYKDTRVTGTHTGRYHIRLSENDDRPRCATCQADSEYYCNMNDQYFCQIHVVGHDGNE